MDAIFFLRSYGDFIVALHAFSNSKNNRAFILYASKHLQPLYESLPPALLPANTNIQFTDIGIRHTLLSCFTNKFFFTIGNVKELNALGEYMRALKKTGTVKTWYLEQSKRKLFVDLFTETRFQSIHHQGNIYQSYQTFLGHTPNFADDSFSITKNPLSIIVFPDSRKAEKILPGSLLQKIKALCTDKFSLRIAHFAGAETTPVQAGGYRNFSELVQLLQSADFIISSDSLPAHLAQLLNKPHWIFYNQKINTEWITPYAQRQGNFACFDEVDKLDFFLNKI
jgi:ADP-heptose:LPS heptosyltransferase